MISTCAGKNWKTKTFLYFSVERLVTDFKRKQNKNNSKLGFNCKTHGWTH